MINIANGLFYAWSFTFSITIIQNEMNKNNANRQLNTIIERLRLLCSSQLPCPLPPSNQAIEGSIRIQKNNKASQRIGT